MLKVKLRRADIPSSQTVGRRRAGGFPAGNRRDGRGETDVYDHARRKTFPAAYIDFMNTHTDKLSRFINMYHAVKRSKRPLSVRSGYYRLFFNFFLWVFNVSLDFATKPYEIEVLNNILWDEIK